MTTMSEKGEDLTGRDRLAWNVLTSWGGYLVFVIAGFVMPRLIDHYVGQALLGVWDFSWSLVNYMNVASLGVGSSVNRYVGKYRAAGEHGLLNGAVASVVVIQFAIAFVVGLLTVLAVALIPLLLGEAREVSHATARWVVGLLGISVAVQMGLDAARGVVTGCHRWDLHNAVNAGSRAVGVLAMAGALIAGGGLTALAATYLGVVVVTESIRVLVARRVCHELSLDLRLATWSHGKEMLLFGAKSVTAHLPWLVSVQTASILVTWALGPAALAVFARPVALIRHVQTFVNKFAFVLTPTAGSLQGQGKDAELAEFVISATRYGAAITIPLMLVLAIYGDYIVRIWMGPSYVQMPLIVVLAALFVIPISQEPALRVLMGINRHGPIALLASAVTVICLAVGAVGISWWGWTLARAALLAGIPLLVSNGILLPLYACRTFGIRFGWYLRCVFALPALAGATFGAILYIARLLMPSYTGMALASGLGAGSLVLSYIYWRWLLSSEHRRRVAHRFRRPDEQVGAEMSTGSSRRQNTYAG